MQGTCKLKRLPVLAVLISGNGTNLQSLIDSINYKQLDVEIGVVISSNPDAYGLERAKKYGIPSIVHNWQTFKLSGKNRYQYDEALVELIRPYGIDIIVLAGFMRILSNKFLKHYANRVINIHPAYLPGDPIAETITLPDGSITQVFRGKDVVKKALDAGVKFTGCTVHVVTELLDAGPVIARTFVPILYDDTSETLHKRIQEEEHKLLPKAVAQYLNLLANNLVPFTANMGDLPKAHS